MSVVKIVSMVLLMAVWFAAVLYFVYRWMIFVTDLRERLHPREKTLSILDPGDGNHRKRSDDMKRTS